MTREDIDNIISIICPNDEDFGKPIISPAYLKKELETLALEQEPCDKYIKEIDHLRKYISKLETQIVEQEPKSPCDLCRYNPPSSADGKPCTMCPAEGRN